MSFPVLPEWATDDIQDPVSQQYNVVEPPTEKKSDGWFLGEKPNRQWWNWLQRQTYLCLVDLYTRVAAIVTELSTPPTLYTPVFSGLDTISINRAYWSRVGDAIFIQIHITYTANTLTTPISFTLPVPSNSDGALLQHVNVNRAGLTTLPNGLSLSAQILSSTSTAQLWGEDLVTGSGSQVSGITADSGQLSIHGFYYADPL